MAVLELDFDAPDADEVAPPLDPVIDNFDVRNDVTVNRREGGSVRVVDEDGPLGVNTIGRVKGTVNVNTAGDGDLPSHATWHLILGTVEGARYPQVTVDLDAAPASLATAAAAVGVGDMIRLSNLPDDLDPQLAELIILGDSESALSHRRLIIFNTTPATIYQQVGVYGVDPGGVVSRYDSDNSTLASDATSTATSLSVATTAGYPLWTTDATQFPFDINISGIRITATNITNAVTDTFTRTETSGWNAPDVGPAWAVITGPATDITVSGGLGRHSLSAAGAQREVALDVAWADIDITISDVGWPVIPTGTGNPEQSLKARFVDSNNFVEIALFRTTADTTTMRLRQLLSGVQTDTGFVAVSGASATSTISLRLQADGSTLRAKVWQAGNAEPDEWSLSLTATMLSAGQIQLRTSAPAGSTNVFPIVATYDGVTVPNPQTFTVVRSVDGIDKALDAGDKVSLWAPARYGL